MSLTSSKIRSRRMISRFAASTVKDTRSTSGSTLSIAGSSDFVMRCTLSSVGSSCSFILSTVVRVLRTVITSSITNHTKATPSTTYTIGKTTPITSPKSTRRLLHISICAANYSMRFWILPRRRMRLHPPFIAVAVRLPSKRRGVLPCIL